MTMVIRDIPIKSSAPLFSPLFFFAIVAVAMALSVASQAWAQQPGTPSAAATGTSQPPQRPAEELYLQLRSVGLDNSRVYNIRDATLDRGGFHVTFDDGTIAFTEDVAGRITGAFFEGEGEVLLVPQDQAERASMTLFTGAAILEERFLTAYFRFNDDTFLELKPSLRPAEHSHEFVTQWNPAARNLAEGDALRLLLSFSQFLPPSGPAAAAGSVPETPADEDRMLHARVQGRRLGIFDLYFDSMAPEQVAAAQLKTVEGQSYYDVWTSFSVDQPTGRSGATPGVISEEAKPDSAPGFHNIRSKPKSNLQPSSMPRRC